MDVQWSTNTTTVSYLQPDYYIFERSMSVGDPKEDQVTALNFILVVSIAFPCGSILNVVELVSLSDSCSSRVFYI